MGKLKFFYCLIKNDNAEEEGRLSTPAMNHLSTPAVNKSV